MCLSADQITAQKWSFPISISSVNVAKSTEVGTVYQKQPLIDVLYTKATLKNFAIFQNTVAY